MLSSDFFAGAFPRSEAFHVYFHRDLDGLISAAQLGGALKSRGMPGPFFHPLTHSALANWSSTRLEAPAAVLDFRFHREASIWIDHHWVSPEFLKSLPSNRHILHASEFPSCASLMAEYLARVWLHSDERFRAAIEWADVIDPCRFDFPDLALDISKPFIALSGITQIESDAAFINRIVQWLMTNVHDVERLILEPWMRRHRERLAHLQRSNLTRLRKEGARILQDRLFVYDSIHYAFHKYLPFCAHPEVSLALGLVRQDGDVQVILSRNPWRKGHAGDSLHLGRICAEWGGGGHSDRGGVFCGSLAAAESVRGKLLHFLLSGEHLR